MKFKKIRIKNIRSYRDQEMEFPDGSFLLSGDVGSGKTSLLLALEYALFGLQPGQKGSSLLRNDSSTGEVELDLEISGRPIKIERKLKRTQKGVSNEYAAITIDGEKIESSITEIKSKIVELMGYPQEFIKKNNLLYRYTVYTPQEQMKQIILEDPESRLNILRHVFGVEKYKQIKNNLQIVLIRLKNESKVLQSEINSLDQDKETLESRKSDLTVIQEKINVQEKEKHLRTMNRQNLELELIDLEKKIDERRSFLSEIEKTKIMAMTKKENINSLENEIRDLSNSLTEDGLSFNEENYKSLIDLLRINKRELDVLIARQFELTSQINSITQDREEILSKKERIFKIDICPTCLQDVSQNHKHNIVNETETKLSRIRNSLQSMESETSIIHAALDEKKKLISRLEDEKMKHEISKSKISYLEKTKSKIEELKKKKSLLEEDVSLLFKHIDKLKETTFEYSLFENQVKRKQLELKQALLEEKNTEIFVAELKKEIEWANKEITNIGLNIKKKEESKLKYYNLMELIDWLSNSFVKIIELIELNVLLKLRKEFSILFRKWFLSLVSEGSLDTQIDENFTPIILQGGAEMEYSFLSGGERTAVALAYRLALNQTINSMLSKIKTRGIIILDEPTEGFSEVQVGKIRDILEELNAEQLIIVSHEQKVEGFVENVLKVVKEGDSSVVESLAKIAP